MTTDLSVQQEAESEHWGLIDCIYETGRSPQAWPVLLDSLYTSFGLHKDGDWHEKPARGQAPQVLWQHFERALLLNQYIDVVGTNTINGGFADIPYPLVVFNEDMEVVFRNDAGAWRFPPQAGIEIAGNKVIAKLPEVKERLSILLNTPASDVTVSPIHRGKESSENLLAISLSRSAGRLVALAWFDPIDQGRLTAEHCRQLFDLTEAESQILDRVVLGTQTADIAVSFSITPETVRSHLKSIYRKTSTSGKSELIQVIKCGPAFLSRFLAPRSEMFASGDAAEVRRNQTTTLADGRRLGFAEYGATDGVPVLLIHNLIGSRMQIPTDEGNIIAQNLRLIVPDRPGVGLSDPAVRHSLESWCADITELVDELGLQRFFLIGSSLGAVYALALARHIPERVERFAMVSCVPEISDAKVLRELLPSTRRLFRLVHYAPKAVEFVLKFIVRKGPQAYLDNLVCDLPQMDQDLYHDPAFHRMMVSAVRETLRQGTSALLNDIRLMATPWGFSADSINVPVHCWHGQRDEIAPYSLIRHLSESLGDCRTNLLSNETHWLLYRHWNTIVADLIDQSPP